MKIVGCGFVAASNSALSSFEEVYCASSEELSNDCQLASGGLGYFAVIKSGDLWLQHGQLKQQLSGWPEGAITAAVLGWNSLVVTTDSGLLYSCGLPTAQPASAENTTQHSNEGLYQHWVVTVAWKQFCLPKAVQAVAAGEHHSAALTTDGTVWTWGSNSDCQLGVLNPAPSADGHSQPQPVAGPAAASGNSEALPSCLGGTTQAMTAIACGARHTCAVGHSGQLLCWGWSLHGQCGQGRAVVSVPQPQVVPALGGLKVTQVAAGLAHTVALTDSGDVYSWGWNADGQLGLGDDQSRAEPELVADAQLEDVHITQVCCGARHTLVKDDEGAVFSWGWNKYGQLGLGDVRARSTPCQVQVAGVAEDIACGWWHSMMVVMAQEA